MSLNFLYNLLTSLTFNITFEPDSSEKQDFFIFHGENSTAHLFRTDDIVKFVVTSNSGFRHYETTEITSQFKFTWDGFKINDRPMHVIKSNGNISDLDFNGYTFLSPSVYVNQRPESNELKPLCDFFSKTNYGLVALIVLGVGLFLRLDSVAPKFWQVFTKLCMQSMMQTLPQEEDPYTTAV